MNDRDFITSIRDQCNAHLGGGGGGGGGGPSPQPVPSITTKPDPFADVGIGNSDPAEVGVLPNQVVAIDFTVAKDRERNMRWFGAPGQFWTHNSWAIFDSGGGRVMGGDNVIVAGTLGFALIGELNALAHGAYRLAVATNGSGNLAFQFVQN